MYPVLAIKPTNIFDWGATPNVSAVKCISGLVTEIVLNTLRYAAL